MTRSGGARRAIRWLIGAVTRSLLHCWTGSRGLSARQPAFASALLAVVSAVSPVHAESSHHYTLRVRPKPFKLVLRERGVVEAAKTCTVYAGSDGEIIWIAEEGSIVKKGDAIVKMANTVFEEEADQAKRELEDQRLNLRRSELDQKLGKRDRELEGKRLEVAARVAEWELRDLKQRATDLELKMMRIDLEIAKAQMENAKLELETVESLKDMHLEAGEELKNKRAAYEKASIEHDRRRDLLEAAQEGPNKRRIALAEQRLEQARRNYERQELSSHQQAIVDEANIATAKAYLPFAIGKDERNRERVERLTVTAPMDGTVVLSPVWKGEGEPPSPIEIGESRDGGMDLLKIADLSVLRVRLHVSEVDVSKVRVGQRATIRLVAAPDKIYEGEVQEIKLFAEDKNVKLGALAMMAEGTAGVNVVDVFVKILNKDEDVQLGLTARADIVVHEEEGVLTLPHTAIVFDRSQPFCYMRSDGTPLRREITLGVANEHEVVVTSGLKEGEIVYRYAAEARELIESP